jgi:hypothetical protein
MGGATGGFGDIVPTTHERWEGQGYIKILL